MVNISFGQVIVIILLLLLIFGDFSKLSKKLKGILKKK